jgi:hypothetical protein
MRDDVFGKGFVIDEENGAAAGIVVGHCNCGSRGKLKRELQNRKY